MSDFKIIDNSQKVLNALYDAIPRALEAVGAHLEGEAKDELENTPRRIDTGLLRNSITYAVSGKPPRIKSYHGDHSSKYDPSAPIPSGSYSGTAPNDPVEKMAVYVGTNVEYAPYVHEGRTAASGKKIAPNRFLKNAVEKNKDQIRNYLERELRNA